MTANKIRPLLIAVVIVALTLANAGCVGSFVRNIVATPTPTPVPATPTPVPTITATPVPTPLPTIAGPVDLIFTKPLEAGANDNSAKHVLTGNITYNGYPAEGFAVLVDTIDGCEYGNRTNAEGEFHVTFRDDGSPTYVMKIADNTECIIYTAAPHPVNETGPFSIRIEVPSSKQISVSITP